VMECTVIEKDFMNLSIDDDASLELMVRYKRICQLFQGDFRLLWHNNRLISNQEIAVYQQLISL
jgi:hypothetical protein